MFSTKKAVNLAKKIGRVTRSREKKLISEGNIARDRKDWFQAYACYKTVVDSNPSLTHILIQMGHAAKELGNFNVAESAYLKALAVTSEDDDLYLQIGHLEKIRGNYDRAVEAYGRAMHLNASNHDARKEYNLLSNRQGETSSIEESEPKNYRELGDKARDAKQWNIACSSYKKYLGRYPFDFDIIIQLGNCTKELGLLSDAESIYLKALSINSENGDLYLQLAHVAKLKHDNKKAEVNYRKAFSILKNKETAAELIALGCVVDYPSSAAKSSAKKTSTKFIDIFDLLYVLKLYPTVSGIQRVQFGIIQNLINDGRTDYEFVILYDGRLWILDKKYLRDLVYSSEFRLRENDGEMKRLISKIEEQAIYTFPNKGDVYLSTGVLYFRKNIIVENIRLKSYGMKLGALIYDYIPLTYPEYVAKNGVVEFATSISDALSTLDFVLCDSCHVASETKRLMDEAGYPSIPVEAITLAHVFDERCNNGDEWTPKIMEYEGVEYILCVGTAFQHKNHMLLLQAWKIMLAKGGNIPLLILAGKHANHTSDLTKQIESSAVLSNYIRFVDAPSDQELVMLYKNCLFTILPSIVEGWGLPIGESLSYGKLCLASNSTSIPEVGGKFVKYFDMFNARECADLIEKYVNNRSELRAEEDLIKRKFSVKTWRDFVNDLIEKLDFMESTLPVDNTVMKSFFVKPGEIIKTRRLPDRDWQFGNQLAPFDEVVRAGLPRLILERGWYCRENWGVWMQQSAVLEFQIDVPEGEIVSVTMKFRVAPWALDGSAIVARSNLNDFVSKKLPLSRWPQQAWQNMELMVLVRVEKDRKATIKLNLEGPTTSPWWEIGNRSYVVGLIAILCNVKDGTVQQIEPERFFSAADVNGCSMEKNITVPSLFRRVSNKVDIFSEGWSEAEPWGRWISGCFAQVRFAVNAKSGKIIRIAMVLRIAKNRAATVVVLANNSNKVVVELSENRGSEVNLWIDCAVDDTRTIVIDFEVQPKRYSNCGFTYPFIGLIGFSYGLADAVESRLALAESALFRLVNPTEVKKKNHEDDIYYTIVGHIKGSYSLAAMNRAMALTLENVFPGRVRVEQIENGAVRDLAEVKKSEREVLKVLSGRSMFANGLEVNISQHWPVWVPEMEGDINLAWVAWEESHVPHEMVEKLNKYFDGVLVQTEFVKKSLIDSGVKLPIKNMGCAPDLIEYFCAEEKKADLAKKSPKTGDRPFTFLHVSSCFPRKGIDILIEAYTSEFSSSDNVCLLIKTFENIHNKLPEKISKMKRECLGLPRIEVICQDMSSSMLANIYCQADAMVLPTKGEGFNLPALEALAIGMPLIVTGFGGQRDFAKEDVARQLDYKFAYSDSHLINTPSVWVEPDINDLRAAMRESYESASSGLDNIQSERVKLGRDIATKISNRSTWAQRIRNAVLSVADVPFIPSVSVAWVSTWDIPCGIAEYSRMLLSGYPEAKRDITVFCDDRTPPKEQSAIRAIPTWKVYDAESMKTLASKIDKVDPKVVVIQHHKGLIKWNDLINLLRDERIRNRIVVLTLHNVQEFPEGLEKDRLCKALFEVDRILVHTVNDLNLLKGHGLVNNVTLFPQGAQGQACSPPDARNLPNSESPLIGSYGFFLPHKGFSKLIEAYEKLLVRWPSARLRLVTSEFPIEESKNEILACKALAESLGLSHIEWITDYLPNEKSLEYLHDCDLIVLPYQETPESSSAALRNALASRAPVAVTPLKIFDDARDAVLRMSGVDRDSIADSIASYLHDRACRQTLIDHAGTWLRAHDWPILASRLHHMLIGLLVNLAD